MSNISNLPQYTNFITDVIARIRSAQYEALRAVNKKQIHLYWDLGKQIVEKQTELGWGKSVVELMAKDIQSAFPSISGFSARNLWLMRQFYEMYVASEILQPLVAEIGWSHHLQIMSKCVNDSHKPIGVATYTIEDTLPEYLKALLPSPELLEKHFLLMKNLRNTTP